jgi:hypothetical protein
MAHHTWQAIRNMHFMCELNGLDRLGANTEKFPHRAEIAAICGGENAGIFRLRHAWRCRRLRRHRPIECDPRDQTSAKKHTRNARTPPE